MAPYMTRFLFSVIYGANVILGVMKFNLRRQLTWVARHEFKNMDKLSCSEAVFDVIFTIFSYTVTIKITNHY